MLGLKSTALRFGDMTQSMLVLFYGLTLVGWIAGIVLITTAWPAVLALAAVAAHFVWQISTLDTDRSDNCLARFKSNRDVGLILTLGLLLAAAVA